MCEDGEDEAQYEYTRFEVKDMENEIDPQTWKRMKTALSSYIKNPDNYQRVLDLALKLREEDGIVLMKAFVTADVDFARGKLLKDLTFTEVARRLRHVLWPSDEDHMEGGSRDWWREQGEKLLAEVKE